MCTFSATTFSDFGDHCVQISRFSDIVMTKLSFRDPICKYLDKPIPESPFPNINTTAQFSTGARITKAITSREYRNMTAVSVLTIALGMALVYAPRNLLSV